VLPFETSSFRVASQALRLCSRLCRNSLKMKDLGFEIRDKNFGHNRLRQ